MNDLISRLSEIRSQYNCFNESEEPYYRALSEVIKMLSEQADWDTISRQVAIDALADYIHNIDKVYSTGKLSIDDCKDAARSVLEDLPPAQQETYKDKLNEIASALSEKFAYMNTCLNERDIILGYLGVERSCESHCNTDCTNTKCESHPLSSAQPERTSVNLQVEKISKYQSDFTDLDA